MESTDSYDSSSSNDTDESISYVTSALDLVEDGVIDSVKGGVIDSTEDDARNSAEDGVRCIRRSSRHRKNISYKENGNDDELESAPKKIHNSSSRDTKVKQAAASKVESKSSRTSAVNTKGNVKSARVILDVSESDVDSDHTADRTVTECPEAEFHDFDKEKEEHFFAVNQIWALYDTIDAMPRFYALIKKVFKPGFLLRVNRLEPVPTDESETTWAEKLPFGCGRFRWGAPEMTSDRLSFSHQLQYEKGINITSVVIYPRKGEVWALFKDWDINWSSKAENPKEFKYEMVEVVSEFSENGGIRVSHLEKMRGFVCLFDRAGPAEMEFQVIPPNEMLRFSHRIPSYKMLGTEREGVPQGSFELDPASFPLDPGDSCNPMKVQEDNGRMRTRGSCKK